MSVADHLGRPERTIWRNPWLWLVLALKLVASALFGSHYVRDLFLPFITWFVGHGLANPWDEFARTGPLDAFPYSGVMLALLSAPQAVASWLAPGLVASSEHVRLLLIRLPMLGADLAIFAILCRWFDTRQERVLWIYWCSPILFFISYVHGQVDSIPSALLLASLYYLFRDRPLAAGVLLGMGVAAKMHLLIALPFIAIHLYTIHRGRGRVVPLASFVTGAALSVGALVAPLVGSPGYRRMVLGTRETERLFQIALPITGELKVYIAPVALVVLVLRYASTHRSSRDVLVAFLALAYSALVLLVPPQPGWYYWAIPLGCYFYVQQQALGAASLWLLSAAYLGYYLVFWNFVPAELPAPWRALVEGFLLGNGRLESFAFTALQGSLAIVIFWIYRVGLADNPEYRARRAPILIGIAGDSGSGKHTLARLLRDILGATNTIQTNGDDYHRWPRGHAAWGAITQLSPRGNRVLLPVEHAESLKKGEPIKKPLYDHATGSFTDPMIVSPRPFVLLVGLHSFTVRRVRALLDLRIYMDPEEPLRQRWKIARDTKERGHDREHVVAQLSARQSDSDQYVRPQRPFADWIIAYQGEAGAAAAGGDDGGAPGPLRTRHLVWNDVPIERLVEELSMVEGLQVTWDLESNLERQSLEVAGAIPAATVGAIAARLYPAALTGIGSSDIAWRADGDGVTQLVFVSMLDELVRASGNPAGDAR